MTKYDEHELPWESAKENVKSLNKLSSNKDMLSKSPSKFDPGKDKKISDGRFYSDIGSAHIEGYLMLGKEKSMYVFFHGARAGEIDNLEKPPRFLRNTYNNYVDGTILCLEDPMFYSFEKCKLGWYYGTPEENYREYCARVIKRIAEILHIEVEKIVLFGSSGGGTAAIGISYYIKGVTVVALNPQLDLDTYFRTPEIEEVTGLAIRNKKDKFIRNDNANLILNNKETNFLIMVNVLSDHDYKYDLAYLCRFIDFVPKYGITQKNNLFVWIYEAAGTPYEHSSFETPTVFLAIRAICQCIKKKVSADCLQGFCLFVNRFWKEYYEAKREAYLAKKEGEKNSKLISIWNERYENSKKIFFDIDERNLILNSRLLTNLYPGSGEWQIEDAENSFKMAKVTITNNQWYELRMRMSLKCKEIKGDMVFSFEVLGDPEYIYVSIGAHNSRNGRRYSETANIKLSNHKFSKVIESYEDGWKKYSVLFPLNELKNMNEDLCDSYSAQIKALNMNYDNTISQIFYFRRPKVEKGFFPSDWTPAPEDEV